MAVMRSAWLKYARTVERVNVLAAESRNRDHGRAYDYRRFGGHQIWVTWPDGSRIK